MTPRDETTSGPDLLLELARERGGLEAQVELGLRNAIRDGRLAAGTALPSTRALARDLGVSRRVAVGAYEQLIAEGWLVARRGSGTFVGRPAPAGEQPHAATGDAAPSGPTTATPAAGAQARGQRLAYDFFAGSPDLASFPRAAWLRALREALRDAPDVALHYPDPAGTPALRTALARRLGRARGVLASAQRIVVTTGARQGLALLARALVARGAQRVAVEWPTLPLHVEVLETGGLAVARIPVRADGIDVERVAASDADAVLVTPAHQMPLGVALAPDRRAALLEWAAAGDRLVIEDDYDAEFRFDRRPLGALQALDPGGVAYLGSASKTLAPGVRLGWLALPEELTGDVVREKELDDGGTPVLDQLALARLIESGAFDRHLRSSRRLYAARRQALAVALESEIPGVHLSGMSAGLHAIARLPLRVRADALDAAARARGVGVYPLPQPDGWTDALVLGYASLSEPAIAEGVRRLAAALAEARELG